MKDKIAIFRQWLEESRHIVFFGGAGVSTESGIPDFRGVDGLYHQKYDYPPETILSHDFFMRNPGEFYRFYREKMLVTDVNPNGAHRALARWEQEGRLDAVVTQNIDGLHQKAGSKRVDELHGSIHRNYCMRCRKFYTGEQLLKRLEGQPSTAVPHCDCGGIIKPDVVLYQESLDYEVMTRAYDAIRHADLLIVGGTSLGVYPAAGMIDDYRGHRLVLINKTPTPRDHRADLILREPIGRLFEGLEQGNL